ncbi:MAG: phosphomannomutase/phosphoglucomutase [Candidatus Niyogibacteria bacterium]|nr:phosphomannomutase/phosphoglucomutase [Candidatus Niyogibacteria bacterium]
MKLNPTIFRGYDVRGVYPGEVNEELAEQAGRAIALLTKAKNGRRTVVVGRDVRVSSGSLKDAFVRGAVAAGCEVIDVGAITTPQLYFAVDFWKCAGGAIITASHNPPEYNGVKMVRDGAEPIPPKEVVAAIKNVQHSVLNKKGGVDKLEGSVFAADILMPYIDFLVSHADAAVRNNFRVVADASNGAGGAALKALFERIGVSHFPLYFEPDGRFPNHSPNPLEKSAQQRAKEVIIHKGADFGIILDADGDRIIFLDENGAAVRGDTILALLADNLLKKGATIVGDATIGRVVQDTVSARGGKFKRSKTGHLHIKQAMRKAKAVFAGESSGHYYFKDFFDCDSALFALVLVMNIFAESRRTFSAFVAPYEEEYFRSREYNFKLADLADAERVVKKFKTKYKDGKQSALDGLTVDYDAWWFNLRASRTEPVLRLNIESRSKKLLEEKSQELTQLLDKLCSGKK